MGVVKVEKEVEVNAGLMVFVMVEEKKEIHDFELVVDFVQARVRGGS